ncbi:GatB/GatE catalytic domain-containing protein [Nemania sp. NC0429]|nr:GatB/GatE catalytic domain-containing protein [Nemania sp. NC0429]
MSHIRPTTLSRYLLNGQLTSRGCLRSRARIQTRPAVTAVPAISHVQPARYLHVKAADPTPNAPTPVHVPLRKQLKDEAKRQKASGSKKKKNVNNQVVDGWELTVGIEIHAQLNTARKMFSAAATSFNDDPNTHVAYFDLATPGSQPVFQKETLIPALRAALALGCEIQPVSRFDRKHYFHWDQPSGYQITQYYEPFARHGRIRLLPRDGIAAEDGDGVSVGIRQVQMEQDTAKTLAQPGDAHWIDFNRVGVPLIEIITHPEIHHPATAAALVRKVQALLGAVDACVSGMESGGLRADVNVSVRRAGGGEGNPDARPLGQRTEIKNLSSFKAVEDAIIAERDRQIAVLEAGGTVAGETRGWSIGSTETRRLRGKEGEVDYRYMPDPDIAPLLVGADLVSHLRATLGELPDAVVDGLIHDFGLSAKDAMALVSLDGGLRAEYFFTVVEMLRSSLGAGTSTSTSTSTSTDSDTSQDQSKNQNQNEDHQPCFQLAANWILHELGRLTSERSDAPAQDLGFSADGDCARVPARHLADLLLRLHRRDITAKVAKELLWAVFRGHVPRTHASVADAIEAEGLWFRELGADEYAALADAAVAGQDDVLRQFQSASARGSGFPVGKLMFLVGRMIRLGPEERIDPKRAEDVMRARLESVYVPRLLSK